MKTLMQLSKLLTSSFLSLLLILEAPVIVSKSQPQFLSPSSQIHLSSREALVNQFFGIRAKLERDPTNEPLRAKHRLLVKELSKTPQIELMADIPNFDRDQRRRSRHSQADQEDWQTNFRFLLNKIRLNGIPFSSEKVTPLLTYLTQFNNIENQIQPLRGESNNDEKISVLIKQRHDLELDESITPEEIHAFLKEFQTDPDFFDSQSLMQFYTHMLHRLKKDWPTEGPLSKANIYDYVFGNLLDDWQEMNTLSQKTELREENMHRLSVAILFHLHGVNGIANFGEGEQQRFRHSQSYNTYPYVIEPTKNLRVGSEIDLYGVNLRGADLRGVDLRKTDLRGVNLRGTDLEGVNLDRVNLRGTDLRGVDLSKADLYGADLYGADLRGVKMRGVNLNGANLDKARVYESQRFRMKYYLGSTYELIIEPDPEEEVEFDGNKTGSWLFNTSVLFPLAHELGHALALKIKGLKLKSVQIFNPQTKAPEPVTTFEGQPTAEQARFIAPAGWVGEMALAAASIFFIAGLFIAYSYFPFDSSGLLLASYTQANMTFSFAIGGILLLSGSAHLLGRLKDNGPSSDMQLLQLAQSLPANEIVRTNQLKMSFDSDRRKNQRRFDVDPNSQSKNNRDMDALRSGEISLSEFFLKEYLEKFDVIRNKIKYASEKNREEAVRLHKERHLLKIPESVTADDVRKFIEKHQFEEGFFTRVSLVQFYMLMIRFLKERGWPSEGPLSKNELYNYLFKKPAADWLNIPALSDLNSQENLFHLFRGILVHLQGVKGIKGLPEANQIHVLDAFQARTTSTSLQELKNHSDLIGYISDRMTYSYIPPNHHREFNLEHLDLTGANLNLLYTSSPMNRIFFGWSNIRDTTLDSALLCRVVRWSVGTVINKSRIEKEHFPEQFLNYIIIIDDTQIITQPNQALNTSL